LRWKCTSLHQDPWGFFILMRKILFKAKQVDNGQWVEGDLLSNCNHKGRKCVMIKNTTTNVNNGKIDLIADEVDPETICQLSSITDDKDTQIWEGDIVQFGAQGGSIGKVKFLDSNAAFVVRDKFGDYQFLYNIEASTKITVIGNVFDNPELLKSKPKEPLSGAALFEPTNNPNT